MIDDEKPIKLIEGKQDTKIVIDDNCPECGGLMSNYAGKRTFDDAWITPCSKRGCTYFRVYHD